MKLALALAVIVAGAFVLRLPSASAGPECSSDPSIDFAEQGLANLINDYRADHDRPALALSNALSRSAAWKAAHMAAGDYFGHTDEPSGRSVFARLDDCGYAYNTWRGENISAGYVDAERTFQQWLDSPGHRTNMLNPDFVAIGVGRAYGAGSTYGWYWTADFGGVADGPPPIAVFPTGVGDVDCSDSIDSIDAALILQFIAAIVESLPCRDAADIDQNGTMDASDAALVLQFAAGLLGAASP